MSIKTAEDFGDFARCHRYIVRDQKVERILRMKTAEEMAEEVYAYANDTCVARETRLETIAQALTAYAEVHVSEALEEAARMAETIYGTQFHEKAVVRTGRKIAANIRALKEKA